jgi:alpha,alpha-trehalose phosphorylase
MIRHSAFAVEPWTIRETALDLDVLAQTESLFALHADPSAGGRRAI